jgi:hypothetical protein
VPSFRWIGLPRSAGGCDPTHGPPAVSSPGAGCHSHSIEPNSSTCPLGGHDGASTLEGRSRSSSVLLCSSTRWARGGMKTSRCSSSCCTRLSPSPSSSFWSCDGLGDPQSRLIPQRGARNHSALHRQGRTRLTKAEVPAGKPRCYPKLRPGRHEPAKDGAVPGPAPLPPGAPHSPAQSITRGRLGGPWVERRHGHQRVRARHRRKGARRSHAGTDVRQPSAWSAARRRQSTGVLGCGVVLLRNRRTGGAVNRGGGCCDSEV